MPPILFIRRSINFLSSIRCSFIWVVTFAFALGKRGGELLNWWELGTGRRNRKLWPHYSAGNLAGNMPSIAVRDVAETRDETPKYDLLWSLQPVFNGLRILGFDLDVNRPGSVHRRRAFLGLKMLVVFVTGESSVALILQGFRDINKGSPIYFSVFLLLMAFLSISFTITLLGAVQFKWSALWDKVREVERSTTFTADFYKLMGKAATPSILFLISLVSTACAFT